MDNIVTVRSISMTAAAMAAFLLVPSVALAQFDHLTCMKVKDSTKFAATVALDAMENQFDPPGDSTVVGKARLYCVASSKQVISFEIDGAPATPLDVPGPEPVPDRICYKVKCPKSDIDPELVHDQFGARQLSRFKVQMLCTPASIGPPPTTTTTTLPPENCRSELIPGQGLACYGFCAGECGCSAPGTCLIAGSACNASSECPPYDDVCVGGLCSVFSSSCLTNEDCVIADGCLCITTACSCF